MSEWIDIKENPPKSQTSLWVTDGWRCAEAYCWFEGKIESAYDTIDTLEGMKDITHYIILPEPPKQK